MLVEYFNSSISSISSNNKNTSSKSNNYISKRRHPLSAYYFLSIAPCLDRPFVHHLDVVYDELVLPVVHPPDLCPGVSLLHLPPCDVELHWRGGVLDLDAEGGTLALNGVVGGGEAAYKAVGVWKGKACFAGFNMLEKKVFPARFGCSKNVLLLTYVVPLL